MNEQREDKSVYDIMEGIADQLCEVAAQVCEQVCKFNEMYVADEDDEKLNEICEKCPLNRLL